MTDLDDDGFTDLWARVRAGEPQAANELVRQYEDEIRRAVRIRLTDPAMRSTLDSIDICQSVMANFFVRAAAGQFDIQSPDQLMRLLVTMAKNKITDHARRQHAARRDTRKRDPSGADKLDSVAAAGQTPSEIVANADLLKRFLDRLTPEERQLAERWSEGHGWPELATEMGDSAEALRKRLSRAIDRAAKELGLDEVSDG